jgi:hypothetical protein
MGGAEIRMGSASGEVGARVQRPEWASAPKLPSLGRGRRKGARGTASGMEFGARPPGIGAHTTLGDREVKNTDVQRD